MPEIVRWGNWGCGKKETAFNIYFQTSTEDSYEECKRTQSIAKTIARRKHQESWDCFISEIQNDIYGH